MKFYEVPETEIVKFSTMDVVVTSAAETTLSTGESGGDF